MRSRRDGGERGEKVSWASCPCLSPRRPCIRSRGPLIPSRLTLVGDRRPGSTGEWRQKMAGQHQIVRLAKSSASDAEFGIAKGQPLPAAPEAETLEWRLQPLPGEQNGSPGPFPQCPIDDERAWRPVLHYEFLNEQILLNIQLKNMRDPASWPTPALITP